MESAIASAIVAITAISFFISDSSVFEYFAAGCAEQPSCQFRWTCHPRQIAVKCVQPAEVNRRFFRAGMKVIRTEKTVDRFSGCRDTGSNIYSSGGVSNALAS